MPEPECEFKELCDTFTGSDAPRCKYMFTDDVETCDWRMLLQFYLNSPQFTKQYAKREELVEEIEKTRPRKGQGDILIWRSRVIDTIRNFGRDD